MPDREPALNLADATLYPAWTEDVLRYRDTDRQGHVNNAVFASLLENGRVAFLYASAPPLLPSGGAFVIARLVLDFWKELRWPGTVRVGTGVTHVSNSSMRLAQGIFVGDSCAATAETVIVLTDEATRKSRPLTEDMRARLDALTIESSLAD